METIRNYNAPSQLFLAYASSFVIGIVAIPAQILAPDFPWQGLDLIDSFFTYAILAQFVHLGWVHLGLNLAGLALVTWGFLLLRGEWEWICIQAMSLLWIAFYLAVLEPIDWYCGLSGALHFQFTACLLLALKRNAGDVRKLWPLGIMVAGLLTKLALEFNSGQTSGDWVGGPIAFQAHRGGAIGGLLMGYALWISDHVRGQRHRSA